LNGFIKQPFSIEKEDSIPFDDVNTLIDLVNTTLRTKDFKPNTKYVAIYISPISKDVQDAQEKNIYFKLKELLLKYQITSQVIYKESINKPAFNFFLPNIAIALLGKLEGIPWRLNRDQKEDLIVGIGAFYSATEKHRYIGSAFCFDNKGIFKEFDCFPSDQTDMLAGSIRQAVMRYIIAHEKAERLIIHYYKVMSDKELYPITYILYKLGLKIPVIIITINKTESKDLVAFDTSAADLMPVSGTIIATGYRQYLLFNNTKYGSQYVVKDWPFPIKLAFTSTEPDVLENTLLIKELIDQIYQFSRMYWKSVKQQNLPVTIKYPEMVAEIFSHFESDVIPPFGKNNLWFL
jgi:argonaute-like protein implicated in RNA metabolism and viral defense